MKRGFLNRKTRNPIPVIGRSGNAARTSIQQVNEKDLAPIMDELVRNGGSVVDLALPENYVPKQREIKVVNALETDADNCEFLFSTIPPKPINADVSAVGPNTWAECLFNGGKQKRAILSIPGFPKPVRVSPETRYRVGPSAHGLGMFATKDLVANDFVLAERPLLVAPAIMSMQIAAHSDNFKLTPAERMQAHLAEVEKLLQICIDRMDPEDRKVFFELHNCHTEDGSGPIFGRVRTNGIGFSIDGPGLEDEELSCTHSGTFPIMSRINHSCTPNVSYFFDPPSFSLRLHAVRPIKAGEELFINYTGITVPTAKRQENLRPYGFQCACDACIDPTWDVRLSSIVKSCDKAPTGPPGEVIKESIRWIKIIEDAKLESSTQYFNHLLRVVTISTVLGRRDDVKEYKAKYEAWNSARGKSATFLTLI
ncbi:hypothetical protein C0995_010332 [Termitomyces sp. Mi166|nr:hypothetical protein C0995_010332 [Termitomyces sp. Mi166\